LTRQQENSAAVGQPNQIAKREPDGREPSAGLQTEPSAFSGRVWLDRSDFKRGTRWGLSGERVNQADNASGRQQPKEARFRHHPTPSSTVPRSHAKVSQPSRFGSPR